MIHGPPSIFIQSGSYCLPSGYELWKRKPSDSAELAAFKDFVNRCKCFNVKYPEKRWRRTLRYTNLPMPTLVRAQYPNMYIGQNPDGTELKAACGPHHNPINGRPFASFKDDERTELMDTIKKEGKEHYKFSTPMTDPKKLPLFLKARLKGTWDDMKLILMALPS